MNVCAILGVNFCRETCGSATSCVVCLAGVCNQDVDGVTHVLYYPSAGGVDNTGAMTIYAWSPEDRWAGANFETPNILGQNRISEEIFTRNYRQPAQREVSSVLAVSVLASSLHHFIASSLHRFIASSLHRSIAPSLHRSIAPSLHRFIASSLSKQKQRLS